jgi:hypothetical protein
MSFNLDDYQLLTIILGAGEIGRLLGAWETPDLGGGSLKHYPLGRARLAVALP